jgi:hypothetical protein
MICFLFFSCSICVLIWPKLTYCHMYVVTIDRTWIGNWIYSTLITAINSSIIAISHSPHFTSAHTKSSLSVLSSLVLRQWLTTVEIPLPVGFRTVPVPYPQWFSANSWTSTTFSRRLTPYRISLRYSNRWSVHKLNRTEPSCCSVNLSLSAWTARKYCSSVPTLLEAWWMWWLPRNGHSLLSYTHIV